MTAPTPADRAPFAPEALEPVLLPFGSSRMLPREAYVSREVFDWEQRHFFAGAWVAAGRVDELRRAGDQRAVRIGGDSVLLVRDDGGVTRGFYNVCRHRAHELLQVGASNHAGTIRCPYHGWTYTLEGALRASGRTGDGAAFDPTQEGLVQVPVEAWRGFLFVNTGAEAPALGAWIGDLEPLVAGHEPERLRAAATHSYEIAANWKLVVENYHECYHCAPIHPQLCKLSPPDSGQNVQRSGAWLGGSMDLVEGVETMSGDGRSGGVPLPSLTAEERRQVFYWGIFPNLLLSPHPDYVLTHRLEPLAPDRTLIECQWLFPPEAFDKPGFSPRYAVDFWDLTNQQDWKAVESVQRGVGSHGYRPGSYNSQEDLLYRFITGVVRGYLDGGFSGNFPPAPERDRRSST